MRCTTVRDDGCNGLAFTERRDSIRQHIEAGAAQVHLYIIHGAVAHVAPHQVVKVPVMQHEADVRPAERHDGLCRFDSGGVVARFQACLGVLGFWRVAGDQRKASSGHGAAGP